MIGKESQQAAQRILDTYHQRTKVSKSRDAIARGYLPGGDTRTTCYFTPYPTYMERGKGCVLYDYDGNEYLDFLNNYTSLIFGHANDKLVEVARAQLDRGTIFGAPTVNQYMHAQHLCERVPSIEMIRYCNSGTEATLFALRAARAFTGKDAVIKMDGGYHGTHDVAEVNVTPDVEAEGMPRTHVVPGVPASTMQDVFITPFNDLDAMRSLIKKHQDRLAAVIVEPIMGAGGMLPPEPDYLKGLRELSAHFGVLLIFDEIISFRVNWGACQSLYGVTPDMTTLGKWIGGGFPVGAFGGRKDIMAIYDPSQPNSVAHGGTFNANNLTMAVGLVALEMVDQPAIDRINALGDRLRKGFTEACAAAGIKAQATGYGSLLNLHWREKAPVTAKESAQGLAAAKQIPRLLHLEMLNRGVYSAPRGLYAITLPMTEKEIDTAIEAFKGALEILKPYVAEEAPHLMVG